MKILLVSDGPFHSTGYGTQIDVLARKMVVDGHKVWIYAPGAFWFAQTPWVDGIIVLGSFSGDDRWGNRGLRAYVDWIQPDVVISWLDCQGMYAYGWDPIPTIMWAPIDTEPIPKSEVMILRRAERLLVPSIWGKEILKQHGLASTYVPCGLDTQLYDIDDEARLRWRTAIQPQIPDETFLIGMVGLNCGSPDRKGYGYAFDIIKAFTEAHPNESICAYLHTNPTGEDGAINLYELRDQLKLEDRIYLQRPGLPFGARPEYMRDLYNAFDVFLHTSLTEGFGLPVIEAQACGVPVVVNACTSVSELVLNGGKAKPASSVWVSTATRIYPPSISRMTARLEAEYQRWLTETPEERLRRRREIRRSVMRFEWDQAYEKYWRPILATIPRPVDFEAGERKLLLGGGRQCAEKKARGFVTHDIDFLWDGVDVIHDLNILPWPWEDNSFDYIEAEDILEHLRPHLMEIMDELWRILAPGGYLYVHTVEAGSWQLMTDPTHVVGYTTESFDYFDPETQWGQIYGYSKRPWKIHKSTMDCGGLVFVLQPRKEVSCESSSPAQQVSSVAT